MATEMAIRGTHDWVMNIVSEAISVSRQTRVLDIGAGQGSLSAKLQDAGLSISACDVEPSLFQVPGIECRRCDESGALPFADREFHLAVAVEVMEHIDGHSRFFSEVARVLQPGGKLIFTTPNILSLKSRLTFLLTGFFYSFPALVPSTRDPARQHISPFSLNRYAWMLSQHGLTVDRVATDKFQRSSLLLAFLVPFVRLRVYLRFGRASAGRDQNSAVALFGRKLLIVASKASAT